MGYETMMYSDQTAAFRLKGHTLFPVPVLMAGHEVTAEAIYNANTRYERRAAYDYISDLILDNIDQKYWQQMPCHAQEAALAEIRAWTQAVRSKLQEAYGADYYA
jgi:hypothetical protein